MFAMVPAISPLVLTAAAVVSTLAGGAMALRFRDRLHYLLGFTAGVLLGSTCCPRSSPWRTRMRSIPPPR
jgi:hypothetical protein